jgi:hypothetical protein
MKRLLGFLLVLAVIAGVAYFWWRARGLELLTQAATRIAKQDFFEPGGEVSVTLRGPVKMTGLRQARVPALLIVGKNVTLKGSREKVALAKLVLKNVDIATPPFHIADVGTDGSWMSLTLTDQAVTDYLRTRGVQVNPLVRIPTDSIGVTFTLNLTTLRAKILVPVVVTGGLVASSQSGRVDLRVDKVKLLGQNVGVKQITDAVGALNPLIDFSDMPLATSVAAINTGNVAVTVRAHVVGARPSLLP